MIEPLQVVTMAKQLQTFLITHAKKYQNWELELVFSHGFNLKHCESDMLIYMTSDESERTPFSIVLPKTVFEAMSQQLNKQQKIRFVDEAFYLDAQVLFSIKRPLTIYDCQVQSVLGTVNQEMISYLDDFLDAQQLALSTWIQERLFSDGHDLLQLCLDIQEQGLQSIALIEALCEQLVGRGSGLTPSGDDFLVGLLLAQHTNEQLAATMFKLCSQTTRTSRAFFFWATQYHAFHFDFIQLHQLFFKVNDEQTLEKQLELITSFGHTSGTDFLVGFQFGLRLL